MKMNNIVRSVYGSYLQTCLLMNLPFAVKANSTLNEKFGIQNGVMPDIGTLPSMRYFAIGNGGHKMSIGAGGIAKPEVVQHKGSDAALYNHLPFILREPTNDISAVDRANYALRRMETHNGTTYVAYYLKRINFDNVVAGMEYTAVNAGVSNTTAFTPDSSNLNPTPPDLSNTGVNVVSGDYVSATAKLMIALSDSDVAELLNVSQVIYQDDGYAIISEVALCSGIDKVVTSPGSGNSTINFNEAIAVQVVSFINTFYPLKFAAQGIDLALDMGATEPLYVLG